MKKEYEILKMNVALTENEECRFYFGIEKKSMKQCLVN